MSQDGGESGALNAHFKHVAVKDVIPESQSAFLPSDTLRVHSSN